MMLRALNLILTRLEKKKIFFLFFFYSFCVKGFVNDSLQGQRPTLAVGVGFGRRNTCESNQYEDTSRQNNRKGARKRLFIQGTHTPESDTCDRIRCLIQQDISTRLIERTRNRQS